MSIQKVLFVVRKTILYYIPVEISFKFCIEGCATYRKTLAAKSHGISSPVKHKKTQRSRKQRVYALHD